MRISVCLLRLRRRGIQQQIQRVAFQNPPYFRGISFLSPWTAKTLHVQCLDSENSPFRQRIKIRKLTESIKTGGCEIRSMASRILRNFSFLTIGKTLGDAITFIFFVVLSRAFGQEGIGQYSFAMAVTGFLVVFADFGLYNFSIKEISQRTDSTEEYYGRILSLRLILAAGVLVLLLLLLPFLPFPRETKFIITLIGAYQVMYTLVNGFAAVSVAREDMHLAGLLEVSLRMLNALGGITVVIIGGSLVIALSILPAITFGYIFVAYRMVTKKYGRLRFATSWLYLTRTLRAAIPYALFIFLRQLSTRADIVFLGFFLGATAAGTYNAAYRLVFLLMFLSYFAGLTLLPVASKLYVNSRKELQALYHKSLNLMILIALPTASGLCLVAPDLINLIFGKAFAESALVLRYLAWLVLLAFVKSIMGIFLTSCDQQVERTRGQWTAAWVNVLGNVVLIPIIGIKGAAIATLISETILVVFFAVRIKTVLGFGWPRIGSKLAMSGIATMSFCLPFAIFSSLSLGIVIPVSILLYLVALVLFREIRRNEIRMLISLLQRESVNPASTDQKVT